VRKGRLLGARLINNSSLFERNEFHPVKPFWGLGCATFFIAISRLFASALLLPGLELLDYRVVSTLSFTQMIAASARSVLVEKREFSAFSRSSHPRWQTELSNEKHGSNRQFDVNRRALDGPASLLDVL
jgi:hypothetical protein